MIDALGLMLITVVWFAEAFIIMFVEPSTEWLLLVPFTGMIALIAGAVLWFRSRRKDFLLFLVSPLASLLVVFIAGLCRGTLTDEVATNMSIGFLALQALFLVFVLYRCRQFWGTATLLAYGFATFAFFSIFIAVMAFIDSWI